ncbi:Membrane associated serine protease, rhomboid family [Tenacibaculum sp. MAR_2010_89]|uniref:rhomboid family intramembrane serine protease n=1 Tax=Tenacibaculum sp. MAR_2010_89 TaxID=1250198 RepID=UPI00089672DA|nr:rhomboid family intramembrane serine protease [Tenacibaculum sp. MAR_2010_89]SED51937.1 Membrane associated serine protease, rhomboid family [Tenacibaculum sp. MAR_2010_89]
MDVLENIKHRFKHAGIVEKLIYVNLIIYFVTLMFDVFSKWFKTGENIIVKWFSLNSSFDVFVSQPWTIFTYGFLHANFIHILFNLIALFYIGHLFKQYFTSKQLLNFYLLGTVSGGILFLLGYNYIPLFKNQLVPLVGASAGISAIFIGIASYIPNYQLKIRFIGFIHLWKLALIWVLLDLIQLSGNNAGGHFAHLGGSLFGFMYVKYASNKQFSIFKPFTDLFKRKEKPLKTVYKSGKKPTYSTATKRKSKTQQEVDLILEKISKSGYETLSKEEKEFLFKQGKN